MRKKTILIVDSNVKNLVCLSYELRKEGYQIFESTNCKDAKNKIQDNLISLIIADTDNLDHDGYDFLQSIQKGYNISCIIYTNNICFKHKLRCFEYGIDDYILKSVNILELLARIHISINRRDTETYHLCAGPIKLNTQTGDVYYKHERLKLARKEYDLLKYLLLNQNRIFTREHLLESVWGYAYEGQTRTVDTHIKKIRNKVDPSSQFVKTVWGKGYKLEIR